MVIFYMLPIAMNNWLNNCYMAKRGTNLKDVTQLSNSLPSEFDFVKIYVRFGVFLAVSML